jgi:hypothetical protein
MLINLIMNGTSLPLLLSEIILYTYILDYLMMRTECMLPSLRKKQTMAKYELLLCTDGYQSDVISFAMTNQDQENM